MSSKNRAAEQEFCLEGQFLGFGREGYKIKSLHLAIADTVLQIKLAKAARTTEHDMPLPGDWVRVQGTQKFKPEERQIKLKAERLSRVTECLLSDSPSREPRSSRPTSAKAVSNELLSDKPLPPAKQQQFKILVCQKSGCQKKGGKRQQAALQEVLRDRGLAQQVELETAGCLGKCSMAPNLVLMPGKQRLSGMALEAIAELLENKLSSI
jgi:hypothetical protein